MGAQNTLEEILNKFDSMSIEEQDLLIELIRNRYLEKRREEINVNARESLAEYETGRASQGTVGDMVREMDE